MTTLTFAGLEILTMEVCVHSVALNVDCEKCVDAVVSTDEEEDAKRERNRARDGYGYHYDRPNFLCRDEATGRVSEFGTFTRYAICSHGRRLPINSSGGIENVRRDVFHCDACEAQRKAGRERDEQLRTLIKAMPKPSKGIGRKAAQRRFIDPRTPDTEELELAA